MCSIRPCPAETDTPMILLSICKCSTILCHYTYVITQKSRSDYDKVSQSLSLLGTRHQKEVLGFGCEAL